MSSATSAALDAPPSDGLGSAEDEQRALDLTARAAAGDLPATQEFLGMVSPLVLRVVTGVLGGTHADLDDVVQQSLIAILRALPAFRGDCHPVGYASRIAFRTALRARRRTRLDVNRRQLLARLSSEEHAATPSQEASEERRRKLLRELLEDLPEEQAETLALRVVLGWSLDEIARATSAPVNTVRSRVRLAKEALRRRIEATPELVLQLRGEP
jgi:RNA polymerase sigma-70 factor (ECF subfamily)